jgi:hypothetical protein
MLPTPCRRYLEGGNHAANYPALFALGLLFNYAFE